MALTIMAGLWPITTRPDVAMIVADGYRVSSITHWYLGEQRIPTSPQ
jgi:hypothetical protein